MSGFDGFIVAVSLTKSVDMNVELSELGSRGKNENTNLRNGSKENSNRGSLERKSGILPLSYRASQQSPDPWDSLTLFLILTLPLYIPTARYCPSLVQQQHVTRLLTLCFATDFCSGDQRPKSVQAQDAS